MGTKTDFPASYYGNIDGKNPVIRSFKQEINSFLALMKRITSLPILENHAYAKGVQTLVEIWKKYKPRLPVVFYHEHVVETADFLLSLKLYHLAIWQGYSLSLTDLTQVNVWETTDLERFREAFFPKGFHMDQAQLRMKVRALLGYVQCVLEQERAGRVLTREGLRKLLHMLRLTRLMMQACQPYEHLSWHLYNGSLCVYDICRYLMSANYSAQALEFLLWASICLELSVTLATTKFLPWKTTLYCSVCQCHYDSGAPAKAEEFARRALAKVNELARLEEHNGGPLTADTQRTYREACIKLSIMVFKHTAFESRPPAVSVDQLTTKFDSRQGRRNPTGRLLGELFESCVAAYFLALLEALRDGRPLLHTRALQEEPETQGALLELFSAGISILSGTSGVKGRKDVDGEPWLECFSALTTESSQLELAVSGQNTVCLASALRFIELLFHYEQHSVFTTLARHMQHALQSMEGPLFRKAESELSLLEGLVCLQSAQKTRSKEDHTPNDMFGVVLSEEFFGMFEVLYQSVCNSAQDVWPDRDLVLAAVLNLWARLKALFQSTELQPLHSKNYSDQPKLLCCLWALYEVASACDLASIDCLTTGELTFRLALLLEHTANHNKQTSDRRDEGAVEPSARSILKRPSGELFRMMCEVTERGLDALSRGWASLPDQTESIDQKSPRLEKRQGTANEEAERRTRLCLDQPGALSLTALDLNLELLKAHHRASLKRLQLNPEGGSEDDLMDRIRNNKMSRAIFLTQKALVVHGDMEPNRTKSLLEEAVVLIEKAEVEERRSFKARKTPPSARQEESRDDGPPPAPLLLSSTNHSLSFIPAPYHSNQQVCWYQICGRAATTIDLRVRLGDHSLQGTGHLVPVVGGQCELTVQGLEHNQKYVFAVAAYGSQGALLGNAIGQSSRPMLASNPLPTLSTWALLAQVAFETEQFPVAKRACSELWDHFTQSDSPQQSPETHSSTQTDLSPTGLNVERLERSSPLLLQWFLSSVFIETDINVQQGALFCDSISEKGLHIWAQNARLAECERLLLAVDVGLWCGDSSAALQAVVSCYGLLAPLIYHQVVWEPMVQVLMKCMAVLENNSALFKERRSIETSEALLHMVACLTYYLARALGVLERSKASQVMVRGQKLLQGLYQAQVVLSRLADGPRMSRKLIAAGHQEMGLQLKGLSRFTQTGGDPQKNWKEGNGGVTHTQDPIGFHHLVLNGDLESAHLDVMKLRRKVFFLEVVVLHLQRAIAADKPDLVVQWATDIFACVAKNDKIMGLSTKGVEAPPTVSLNPPGKHKKHQKEKGEVEAFIKYLSYVRQKGHQRLQRRCLYEEQRVWRSQLNHLMAQAHLTLLHRALGQLHTPAVHESYSQFHPWAFSLARSGVLLAPLSRLGYHLGQLYSAMSIDGDRDDVVSVESSKDSDEQLDNLDPPITPSADLDSLQKAALHLRRAMVLAHRGSHWACLQYACRTAWEQSSSLAALKARDPHPKSPPAAPCPITLDLLESTFTPLLVVATDLLMDMMNTLGLWKALEGEASQEDLESSQVDVQWVQTLVLDTLGLLHARAKWESLAHYALLFNCYTGGRYTLQVSPLLIYAQRRLLERVTDYNGPPVPQPHHVKTQRYTETPVTWRNYADYQLLSGWRPPSRSKSNLRQHSKLHSVEDLKTKVVSRSKAFVRVPLDVEDTLAAYRLALQNRPHSLHLLQHSRTLLQLLLAHTHFTAGVQQGEGGSSQGSPGQVEIGPVVTDGPDPQPQDLTCQDFTNPKQLYSLPLGPEHTHTVIAAYAASIKCLEDHGPRVQALHDLGNLQLYSGNPRGARSSWSKAVDCALHSVGVLDTWDGACWAGGPLSQQETLKLAGVWGCLQAAVITAKTAQYVLVSHIQQRTMCCLLSAHLFKCVLCSSQPHPQRDLLYGSYSVGEELLPGVDLFSDPVRVHPPTTVASLHFLCHWLYSTRHYVTLLPMLAMYLYFVRSRCRNVQRTVEGTLLKVRALTELSMFGQAIKEAVELSHRQGVTLPHGPSISGDAQQPTRKFHDNKPLMENLQAVEELANCQLSEEVRGQCGPVMSQRFSLARVQLVLALCQTVPGLPLPGPCGETAVTTEEPSVSTAGPDQETLDAESPSQGWKDPDRLELELGSEGERLSPGRVKYVLLDWAQRALESSGGELQACGGPEYCSSAQQDLEITIEAHLLLSNMHLQLGHAALSADMAARALEMLKTSASILGEAPGTSHLNAWVTEGSPLRVPSPADCPRAVEARERLGAPLWLGCRLALLRGIAAHLPGTAVHPGPDSSEEAAKVLKKGLNECAFWGDPDTHALMLLVAAAAHTHRGPHKRLAGADPTAMLQEAVRLLSDRTWMPAASGLVLALATMELGALKGTHSTALLEMGQRLLQQQLTVFGESVEVKSGGVILPPQGLNNIYLPQLPLLAKTTMQIGNILALRAAERNSNPAPVGPPCRRELPAGVHRWRVAREVLGSALALSRSSARRDMQLEARLLHCRGIVECSLRFFGLFKRQEVARTFVDCIQTTMTNSHNLQVNHQCYLEVAFLFLQDWQNMPSKTPNIHTQNKGSHWRNMIASLKRLMVAEEHLLPYWVCLRAAHMVMSSMRSTGQLGGSTAAEDKEGGGGGGALSIQELSTLPGFARNDLLHSCGGVSQSARDAVTEHSFKEDSSTHPALTWSHLARYYTHLLNLQHATSTGIGLLAGDVTLAGDVSIAARLSQLHFFYCKHSSRYTETCCPPQPIPSRIMLQAPLTQPSRALRGPMLQEEEEEEVYKWSISPRPQLCVQWYQPCLTPILGAQDTVILMYGYNSHPISATGGSANGVLGLQCGHYEIRMDRVRAVHAELCEVCVLADVRLSAAEDSLCTSSTPSPSLAAAGDTTMKVLEERTLACCLSIQALLRPGPRPRPLTQVPFEVSLENVSDLERCFDPCGGAILESSLLTEWILATLIP